MGMFVGIPAGILALVKVAIVMPSSVITASCVSLVRWRSRRKVFVAGIVTIVIVTAREIWIAFHIEEVRDFVL